MPAAKRPWPSSLMLSEYWDKIPTFDAYSVSDAGRVRNDNTERLLAIRRTKDGVCFVGLSNGGVQRQRGLALLVANSFVTADCLAIEKAVEKSEELTPIHLDGDQSNNQSANLLWRPMWYAQRYARQFEDRRVVSNPIVDTRTGDTYDSLWQAATMFGLLEREINSAIHRRTYVWPTFQEFRFIPK